MFHLLVQQQFYLPLSLLHSRRQYVLYLESVFGMIFVTWPTFKLPRL